MSGATLHWYLQVTVVADWRNDMHTSRSRPMMLVALVAMLALVASACGSDDDGALSSSSGDDQPAAAVDDGAGDPQEFLNAALERGRPEIGEYEDPSELVIIDDIEGTGPQVEPHAMVTVHYIGASVDSGEVFDSSWDRDDTISFPLDGVIQGWSEGLVGMKAGGRRTLVIPAELAYGSTPPPGSGIAPDAALVFVVDMIGVENP